jgi:hypothetical protein
MSQMQTFKAHTAVGTANHQQGLEAEMVTKNGTMTNYRNNNRTIPNVYALN